MNHGKAKAVWLTNRAKVVFDRVDQAKRTKHNPRWFSAWVSRKLVEEFPINDLELSVALEHLVALNDHDIELHRQIRQAASIVQDLKAERGDNDQRSST